MIVLPIHDPLRILREDRALCDALETRAKAQGVPIAVIVARAIRRELEG
jgi:hypothetical protein